MGIIIGLDGVVDANKPFKDIVVSAIDVAKDIMAVSGELKPFLLIVEDSKVSMMGVPDGHQEMAKFFVDVVDKYNVDKSDKTRGYIFITESWVLHVSTESVDEVSKYLNNPDSIADNPFKEERITFNAATKEEEFDGYVEMYRGDDGKIALGETVFETIDERFSNVADLLLPMVK